MNQTSTTAFEAENIVAICGIFLNLLINFAMGIKLWNCEFACGKCFTFKTGLNNGNQETPTSSGPTQIIISTSGTNLANVSPEEDGGTVTQ